MSDDLFIEECQELLTELETGLLTLELSPDDIECVHRIFRALHTIKGSADMLGYCEAASFTNELESVFSKVRSGECSITSDLLRSTLASKDLLSSFVESGAKSFDTEKASVLVLQIRSAIGEKGDYSPSCNLEISHPAPEKGAPGLGYIQFHPQTETMQIDWLLEQLQQEGQTYVVESSGMGFSLFLYTKHGAGPLDDARLILGDDEHGLHVVWLDPELAANGVDDPQVRIKLLAAASEIDGGKQAALADTPGRDEEEMTVESEEQQGSDAPKADAPGASLHEELLDRCAAIDDKAGGNEARGGETGGSEGRGKTQDSASIRVATGKLDNLVDLVGQLVIAQVRLNQISTDVGNANLTGVSEEIEHLVGDLRDQTLSLRMVPIGNSFTKFRRLVRDLSTEMGKQIELETHGGETELDKTVIERLNDPLIHILRNCIDHGIEPPSARLHVGKPEAGRITLRAEQMGGQVHITISDDGKGIDPDRVRSKAVEAGLVNPDEPLSKQEIHDLIFRPGFSTAQSVTSVSGRGVGMDVVHRSLEDLKGAIQISSEVGLGTSIHIRLPLTLAIVDGLHVCTGNEHYVLPLSDVGECVEIVRSESDRKHLVKTFDIHGELIPCLSLRDWFVIGGEFPAMEQIVVVTLGKDRYGIIVDDIIGQRQTVIKGLGKVLSRVQGISGATIMADGSMAVILDVASLMRTVQQLS